MGHRELFAAVAVISLVNGLFSPFMVLVYALFPLWLPSFVPATQPMVVTLSAILTAVATLLLSGVPAALFERFGGLERSTTTSLTIWLAAAVLLTLPAVPVVVAVL